MVELFFGAFGPVPLPKQNLQKRPSFEEGRGSKTALDPCTLARPIHHPTAPQQACLKKMSGSICGWGPTRAQQGSRKKLTKEKRDKPNKISQLKWKLDLIFLLDTLVLTDIGQGSDGRLAGFYLFSIYLLLRSTFQPGGASKVRSGLSLAL